MIRTAVIIAAGLGMRLKDHFDLKPKGFLEIGNLPIIERSINILLKNNINKIIIGTGYMSEYFEKLAKKYSQIKCIKNKEYFTTGNVYTLYNMKDHINDDFLLLESDLIYEEKAIKSILSDPRDDIILASGWTYSGDEFYIEVDENYNLVNMSKNKSKLNKLFAELVGISKISLNTFEKFCNWAEKYLKKDKKIDYEYALTTISKNTPIFVKKIENLIWSEIDNKNHLTRAITKIYPQIYKKENENT